ncbi:MAG: GGDEF domain-containing protein, partial [Actinobacteria bacterium]|nr:GGDEF domain-containing protein [Actinomycetota bacterium]
MVSSSVLGMVNLESRLVDAYSQGDRDFVAALCESTAIAAKNAHLYREVEDMAVKDGLTGLYNRTYFHQTLQSEVERAQRYGGDLSLVLMDVDDFKLYNDRHGHTAGDDVLRWLGRILTASTRKSDVAARYGGEELAVIMPETQGDQALQAAEKLREVIVTQQPAHWPAPVTVSIGVASHPMDGTTPRALIDSADQRMYAAKRSGKNQVVAGG